MNDTRIHSFQHLASLPVPCICTCFQLAQFIQTTINSFFLFSKVVFLASLGSLDFLFLLL